jgi:hypothetical protein
MTDKREGAKRERKNNEHVIDKRENNEGTAVYRS